MKSLKVQRFVQDVGLGHCAVCAAATLGKYYCKDIDYEYAKKIARKVSKIVDDEGMFTGEIGILLNKLGFKRVSIITSDINYLDFSWAKLSKVQLVEKIRKKRRYCNGQYKGECNTMLKFLNSKHCFNNIIIDYNFDKYIRESLDNKNPIIITINWTMFFKSIKYDQEKPNDLKGNDEAHAVVAYRYNDRGVYVLDSREYHWNQLKLKKIRNGRYFIEWPTLMTILGLGDIVVAEEFKME